MPEIKIEVKNKIAQTVSPNDFVVCGNNDYVAVFNFDEEWEVEKLKTAVFSYNGFTVKLPFDGDRCYFPILRNTTLCKVGVFAGDLRTTTPAYVPCKKAITDENGQIPPEIQEDLYDKIIALYDDFGSTLGVSVNSDYVLTVELFNKDGEILSKKSVDLPIENLFISARYDTETKEIVFTLQNGETLSVPVGDLIDGFADKDYVDNAISNIKIPEVDTSNLVTLDGDQTITGHKVFSKISTDTIHNGDNELSLPEKSGMLATTDDCFKVRRWL